MFLYKPDREIIANTFEVHYLFIDRSHTIDAIVQNKCEYEIIGIIQELGKILQLDILIETEPIGEGGVRRWFKVMRREENRSATITTAVLVALITLILITPLTEITEQIIEGWFEDKELLELQKEKLRLEIKKLKFEDTIGQNKIDSNTVIKKKRSNYYEKLKEYPKVESVSFKSWDEKREHGTKEQSVPRMNFDRFVLTTDEVTPIEDTNAVIEIISPVLKKENYKWTGYYLGQPISFSMNSKEFRALIQKGKVEFKNGSSFDCNLIIKRKMNTEGIVINSTYTVTRVNKYFENNKPIETREGRSNRIVKEQESKFIQLKLFDDKNIK